MNEDKKNHDPTKVRHVVGLSFTDYAEVKFLGGDGIHDPWIQKTQGVNIPKNYTPIMSTQPVNVSWNDDHTEIQSIKPFTAAEFKKMQKEFSAAKVYTTKKNTNIIWPKYYQNPYQYQDYVYLQDIYANTICGRIFDTVVHFALARGIKPKLKVRNEKKYNTPEEKQKALKEHHWMIDTLEEIDRNVSSSSIPTSFKTLTQADTQLDVIGPISTAPSPDTPTFDDTLQSKWAASMILALMFGRDCLIPRVDPEDNKVIVKIDDKETTYKNIPKILLSIHPRDMGFNFVDYQTHRLLGIQLNNSNWILKPNEMIFWIWKNNNPVYGSKFYGMSAAQSMMGSARTLRRVIEVDFPLIAKTRWSGMYWLVFKRKGEQVGTSDIELNRILAQVQLNGINATLEDNPEEDFKLHKIDLDPKITELIELCRFNVEYMMAQVGMPQGLLFGEADLNRDTLTKKISTWTKGGLKSFRDWFLQGVDAQWYRRMTKTLEEQDGKWKEAMKDFEVIADVEEFRLEDMNEQVEYISKLQQLLGKPLTTKAIGEKIDEPDLDSMIDPDGELPEATTNYEITDKSTKRKFGVGEK